MNRLTKLIGRFLASAFLVALASTFALAAENDLHLVTEGKSDYTIVLPDTPTPVEKTAASELQTYLEKATGARLPIASEKEATSEKKILLGATNETQKLLGDLKLDKLAYDGIILKRFGDRIVLAGHPQRGTLYAAYTFLEEQLGVRWWASDAQHVPNCPTLSIGRLDTVYAPKLRIRESFYRDMFTSPFAARNKCNGHSNPIPAEFGDHQRFNLFVHSFYPLLPPEKYFKDHPEWYSLRDGKRMHERSQLCLTNDEMRHELTKNAIERLRKDPTAALISISQNDWRGRCECEKCKAIEEAEGSPAGLLLQFVNRVAEDIEKEFPDVLVETLAYDYTRKPPKTVRPRKNVVVRLCSIECSFAQPLESDANATFRDDIREWAKIAPQLYVWDYVTNFTNYLLPHPNLRVLAPNVRFFENHNVIGLFEQGDYQSNIGDFPRMRAWVLARLMWDSSQDPNALIDEFLNGYYGPAAPHLKTYLTLLNDSIEGTDYHLSCFNQTTKAFLDLDTINRATEAFNRAKKAVADQPELARRIDRTRMSLDLAWIRRWHELRNEADRMGKPFLGPEDPEALVESYIARAQKYQIGQWREGRSFDDLYTGWLRRVAQKPAAPPKPCVGLPRADWVDYSNARLGAYRLGTWTNLVEDPQAANKTVVFMPGDHNEWATNVFIESGELTGGSWRCFVVARASATATDGPAMSMGIYDHKKKKEITSRGVSVQEAAGKDYKTFDLGAHDLSQGAQVWIAPPKRKGEVQGVYVDRIYFIREKGTK